MAGLGALTPWTSWESQRDVNQQDHAAVVTAVRPSRRPSQWTISNWSISQPPIPCDNVGMTTGSESVTVLRDRSLVGFLGLYAKTAESRPNAVTSPKPRNGNVSTVMMCPSSGSPRGGCEMFEMTMSPNVSDRNGKKRQTLTHFSKHLQYPKRYTSLLTTTAARGPEPRASDIAQTPVVIKCIYCILESKSPSAMQAIASRSPTHPGQSGQIGIAFAA